MYFFFQAEDGIRDLYVTGVQTCALPIWVDGQMSCSCKEPDCWNKLKKWADPKKWFDPNPAPPPPLVPLVPPFTPTPAPAPVISGLVPILNPCYFSNSLPGCGGDSGWT